MALTRKKSLGQVHPQGEAIGGYAIEVNIFMRFCIGETAKTKKRGGGKVGRIDRQLESKKYELQRRRRQRNGLAHIGDGSGERGGKRTTVVSLGKGKGEKAT